MTVHKRIISGLLELIQLSSSDVKKVDSFDPGSEITGKGVVTAELIFVPAHPEVPSYPDYEISVAVKGMTYMSEDPQQQIIRSMFEDIIISLAGVTPERVQNFFPAESTVFAFFPVGERKIDNGIDDFVFTLNYKIIVGNLLF